MELGVEKLDKTKQNMMLSKVGSGMTRLNKTRKGRVWRGKTEQDRARHGAEQGQVERD